MSKFYGYVRGRTYARVYIENETPATIPPPSSFSNRRTAERALRRFASSFEAAGFKLDRIPYDACCVPVKVRP